MTDPCARVGRMHVIAGVSSTDLEAARDYFERNLEDGHLVKRPSFLLNAFVLTANLVRYSSSAHTLCRAHVLVTAPRVLRRQPGCPRLVLGACPVSKGSVTDETLHRWEASFQAMFEARGLAFAGFGADGDRCVCVGCTSCLGGPRSGHPEHSPVCVHHRV